MRGVRFAPADDTPLFGIVVISQRMVPAIREQARSCGCMIGFMAEAQGRRLMAALRRSKRTVRIPMDRACLRVVRIVVMLVRAQMNVVRFVFEPVENVAFNDIAD